jgi:hypothetical protein
MWSELRETVAGFAEQAGIEIPGLEAGAAVVTDLAGPAETVIAEVLPEGAAIGVVDAVEGLTGSTEPAEAAGGAVRDA